MIWLASLETGAQGSRHSAQLTYAYRNLGLGEKRSLQLIVAGGESLSIFQRKEASDSLKEQEDEFSIDGEDSHGRQVYKNMTTRELLFRDFYPQGLEFEPCLVKDPLSPMSWVFGNGRKRIGNYTCREARTSFRGRSYQVWFTEDLPISHGPWKFSGLPGAMVEIRSDDGIIEFTLQKVASFEGKAIEKPTQGVQLTMYDYVRIKEASVNDFINTLKAKLPRGAEVTVNASADYNLETDFSDVKK